MPVDKPRNNPSRSGSIFGVLLRLSYLDGHRLRAVTVRAQPGTPWGVLAPHLGLAARSVEVEYAGRRVSVSPDLPLGSPPLVHGAVVLPRNQDDAPGLRAPVSLQVTAGPDCGGSYALRPGQRLRVGRDQWCEVVIADAGLSRHHLTLTTTREGIVLDDSSSTNGTTLGSRPVVLSGLWPPGEPVRAGQSTLELRPHSEPLARGRADHQGHLLVESRSRPLRTLETVELELPQRQRPTSPMAPSVLGWLLPLVVSVLLAVLLSMPALMLFGLMAPAMSLGSYVGERRRYRRATAQAAAAHEEGVRLVQDQAHSAVAVEVSHRQERTPDLPTLIEAARSTGDLLWSRAGGPPLCRLGLGRVRTGVTVDGRAQIADYAPVEVDLTGGLALVGPPELTRAVARSLVLQLAVLHPPDDLRIALADPAENTAQPISWNRATQPIADGEHTYPTSRSTDAEWEWLAWLPHTLVGEQTLLIHDLTEAPEVAPDRPATEPSSSDQQGQHCPLVLCRSTAQVPQVGTTVLLSPNGAQVLTSTTKQLVSPDGLSRHRATATARVLAALRVPSGRSGAGAVPERADLAALAPTPPEPAALARAWQQAPRSTRFVLGQGADGPIHLDLASDGPHALIAGTTGSGKSELLRTMITSLALVNRPDELVMVLVDYKGGSAFADAADLPHVVGLITDLDPHLADRALTSLTAELKRRERILAQAGVPDLPAYQGLPQQDPLPRLMLVIDEFRALAEELPGFLDGLVRIAALGRSLGVHLVLATQRPGGVVSADVRANVNLRISLRVRDSTDSYDVIDSPAAAELPEGLPGRALIRTGTTPPREVQVANSSTPAIVTTASPTPGAGEASWAVSIQRLRSLWEPDRLEPLPQDNTQGQDSFLTVAASAASSAAQTVGAVPPPSPWLPALPEQVPLQTLPAQDESRVAAAAGYDIPLLLTDLPAAQAQPPHHWRPLTDGHLGVLGAGRTGRSTLARTVLAGLLARHPDDVHCYVFDLGGALGPVAAAPHVGAVVGAGDVGLGSRVLAHLVHLIAARQGDLAAAGHTSLAEQRATDQAPWPLVVLVIDGWARFAELYGQADRGRPLEQALQLLREGVGVGVVAVVTGDRSLLSGRVSSLLPELWALRLTDPADLLMAGLTRAQVPVSMPPGRVVRLRDGVVGQVAVVGEAADGRSQLAALAALLEGASERRPARSPMRFRRLPRTVAADTITDPPAGLLVGLGGDDASPVCLPVEARRATLAVVLGPPGSGRSTTLVTIAGSARAAGWAVLTVGAEHARDSGGLPDSLAEAGKQGTGLLVLVDGLAGVAQTQAEDVLLTWVEEVSLSASQGGQPPRALVVAADPGDIGGFRGLGARLPRERVGVILQPTSPSDGSPLGVSVPTGDDPLPGRGVLVVRGTCLAVQVAQTDS